MFDEQDYNEGGGIGKVIPMIIFAIVGTIVMAGIFIPITVDMAYETVSNTHPSGIFMDYSDDGVTKNYTIEITDGKLKVSGDYAGTVAAKDQIVVLADSVGIYVQDGHLYKVQNGVRTDLGNTVTVTVTPTTVQGTTYDWIYFPASGGEYSSFTDVDHIFSDKVGVSLGSMPGIVYNWTTYEINGKNVIGNVILKA